MVCRTIYFHSDITVNVNRYGTPTHPLPRRVIPRGIAQRPTIEMQPLRLKVFKLVRGSVDAASPPHPWITISAGETIATLCTKVSAAVAPENSSVPYRVWKIGIALEDSAQTEFLDSQLPNSDAKIVDESEKTLEADSIESDDAFVVEFKQPDGWIAEAPRAIQQPTAIEGPRPLFGSNDGFFDKLSTSLSPSTSTTSTRAGFYNFSSSGSKAFSSLTVGNNKGLMKTLEPGTLGLGNMLVLG